MQDEKLIVNDDQAVIDGVEGGWIVNPAGDVRGALRINRTFRSTLSFSRSSILMNGKFYQFTHIVSSADERWGRTG